MTHSIFTQCIAIFAAALFAAAILWGEHYQPHENRPDPRVNYVMGVMGMLIPFFFLLLFWGIVPPPGSLLIWVAVGLAFIVAMSGLLVHVLYEVDGKRRLHQRAKAAELAEKAARHEPA